jgi:glycosyltransferase involved in cell wall biosynthesis
MEVIQVAPALPVDVREQCAALSERGWLARLVTSWVRSPNAIPSRFAKRLDGHASGRRPPPVREAELLRVPNADLLQLLGRFLERSPVRASDRRFAHVDRAAAALLTERTDLALCREDAAIQTFGRARALGAVALYDLPTAHFETVRSALEAEHAAFPEADDRARAIDDFAPERLARKRRELELASLILVPSTFTRDSLLRAGVSSERVRVLPFGCDHQWAAGYVPAKSTERRPVVLSVGEISVRKGSHRLLRAWQRLGAHRTHRLRLIGPMALDNAYLKRFAGLYQHVPTMPRSELAVEYAGALVFVFNGLADGWGLVVTEAMSLGTPVIVSRNCGAADVVTDGREGLLVEFGDDDGLADALEQCLGAPGRLAEMGYAAIERCRAQTWSAYRSAFLDLIAEQCAAGGRGGMSKVPDQILS